MAKYRYFNSEMWSSGKPKPWVEVESETEVEIIYSWMYTNLKVWDADICGSRTVYFMFDNDRCFELEYAWWIEHDPEWEVCDEYTIEEVPYRDDMNLVKDRDWLVT